MKNASDFDKLGRRKFLSTSTMSMLGYSLMVSIPENASAKDAGITKLGKKIEGEISGKPFTLDSEPNMDKIELDCDVLVCGGGLAGVCAAIAAARNGAKTVLIQDRSRLGGNSSSEIRMHPLGLNAEKVGWREGGILEEIKLENAYKNPQTSWELWDLLLYDKCVSEPNLTLLLDTPIYRAETKNGKVVCAYGRCDRTLKIYKINAREFIDCTGDGRLAMESGAHLMDGREGTKKYGESLADTYEFGKHLCASIIFTTRDVGKPNKFYAPSWAKKLEENDFKFRNPRSSGFSMGYWFISHGGLSDTLRDNEVIRFELLSIVMGIWDYVKNSGKFPETQNLALDTVGMLPGKRDTYRIEGEYIFKQQDIQGNWRNLPDQIVGCGWPMEDQPSAGFYASRDKRPAIYGGGVDFYNIPFGSLVAKGFSNLFMAGRNQSSSHIAFTSTRIMNTCALCGQVAGTAAAICAKDKISAQELRSDPKRFSDFQQQILRDGVAILNVKNSDPLDLARTATATASESVGGTKPSNAISGSIIDTYKSVDNKWRAPISTSPWIKLEWNEPKEISSVILNLDTGARLLTISRQTNFMKRIITGGQPECLKNYKLTAILPDGSEKILANVKDNFQKRVVHKFGKLAVKAIRLDCIATNGSDLASLYEIRAYA